MEVMFVLIGVSMSIAASFLAAFLWAVKNGQFDDCDTPSQKMLWDDGKISKGPVKK